MLQGDGGVLSRYKAGVLGCFNVHFGISYLELLKARKKRAEILSICPEVLGSKDMPKTSPELPDPTLTPIATWRPGYESSYFFNNHYLNQVPVHDALEESAGECILGNAIQSFSEEGWYFSGRKQGSVLSSTGSVLSARCRPEMGRRRQGFVSKSGTVCQ